MLVRDDHWKLPARKLPDRLDLLVGCPSLSASLAPSCCELENGAVNEKLGKPERAPRQPEVVDSEPEEHLLLVNRSPSLRNCLVWSDRWNLRGTARQGDGSRTSVLAGDLVALLALALASAASAST